MSALDFDDHRIPGYKPIIGGLRHLTYRAGKPLPYTIVALLCGGSYRVAEKVEPHHLYDCSHCFDVWCETQNHPAAPGDALPPGDASVDPLGGRVRKPAGTDGPETVVPAGPPTLEAM
ncbi:hypothetical protein ABZ215_38610 [Amycolatopsis sp. NPDC006131]|uniref:hypothetical protein n=1 Tax=Amycolatopsis sp. NPDC006131 TaxID=3156731 RepID=UPI0033B00506